jgi:hypothetical protein
VKKYDIRTFNNQTYLRFDLNFNDCSYPVLIYYKKLFRLVYSKFLKISIVLFRYFYPSLIIYLFIDAEFIRFDLIGNPEGHEIDHNSLYRFLYIIFFHK